MIYNDSSWNNLGNFYESLQSPDPEMRMVEEARKRRLLTEATGDCPVLPSGSLDGMKQLDQGLAEAQRQEAHDRHVRRREAVDRGHWDAPVRSVLESAPVVKYDRRQALVSLEGGIECDYSYAPVQRR
jgi:hypothetical protein